MLVLGLLSSENRFTPQATGRRVCESPTSVSYSYELVSRFCRFGGIWGMSGLTLRGTFYKYPSFFRIDCVMGAGRKLDTVSVPSPFIM